MTHVPHSTVTDSNSVYYAQVSGNKSVITNMRNVGKSEILTEKKLPWPNLCLNSKSLKRHVDFVTTVLLLLLMLLSSSSPLLLIITSIIL
jgi:hypothetical protein